MRQKEKHIKIIKKIKNPVVDFAGKELIKYLKLAGLNQKIQITLNISKREDGQDHIDVKPDKNGYVITGSNNFSLLFGVYRFLNEIGFRWIRPGKRGEIIPKISRIKKNIKIKETASYKYRTICIEGASSFQHVRDIIDWAAKNGMNGYFIQFNYGKYFFKRWYEHLDNPYMKKEKFDDEMVKKIVDRVINEIKKRGMRLERMGHGWTCLTIGIEGEGWSKEGDLMEKIPEEKRNWLALIDGKRGFYRNIPLDTNLCYSNPAVRSAIVDKIVEYANQHSEVDAIHFWLADGSNNNCECDECKKKRVSDYYVMILNELDEKLKEKNILVKIVFLIYVDLLWPPEKEKIKNQDRFILMFAPITRSYLQSFADTEIEEGIKPYIKNKLEFPKSAGDNVLYLKKWQEIFKGEGVDFDYHLIWPCYYDLNHFTLAKVLYKDIVHLKNMNLCGFISCQNQRASFPTNFLMDVMAKTLWNRRIPFLKIVNESFSDAFGKKDAEKVVIFLKKMSDLSKPFFEPVFIPNVDEERIKEGIINIGKMKKLCEDFKNLIDKKVKSENGAVGWSWKYMKYYIKLLDFMLPAMESYLKRKQDCREKFEKLFDFLRKKEKILHPAFDVSTFIKVMQWRINEVEGRA
jgi:hypothetical protein